MKVVKVSSYPSASGCLQQELGKLSQFGKYFCPFHDLLHLDFTSTPFPTGRYA
ncbi:hypothetical protein [Nostoc sp. UHCC 0302]|uniref:hypothetical protein n=1 Tax=Nostoc sp. UHCC 0302 TaxID=3134896 RepID=UPI00311CBED0